MRKFVRPEVIEKFVPMMRRRGVSEISRSPIGFLTAYFNADGDPKKMHPEWLTKRDGFIARHMAQVIRNDEPLYDARGFPTRRHLALIAWAYTPDQTKISYLSTRL